MVAPRRQPLILALAAGAALSSAPAQPPEPPNQGSVIYGVDDRHDVYQVTDPDQLSWAHAVCGLVLAVDLDDNGDGTWSLDTGVYTHQSLPPCPGEPFAGQPVLPYCSGFLAAPDIVVTAGHCLTDSTLPAVRFVFGFQMQDALTPVESLPDESVYTGVAILERRNTPDLDYAVVQLDRPVTTPGVEPLRIRRIGGPENGTPVGLIGHPSGLPLKVAFGDQTRVADTSPEFYFFANLDAYGGNSGSPVIDPATGIVEGILVRGEADFLINGGCFSSRVLPDAVAGEEVTRTTVFQDLVPFLPGEQTSAPSWRLYGEMPPSDTSFVSR